LKIIFGWIGNNGIEEKKSFYNYIDEEIIRNIKRIKKCINNYELLKDIIEKSNIALEKLKQINNIKPVISWYDINSNNILVNEKSEITGFLDPGGARIAAKEWDLAFIKMDLCQSSKEYEYFREMYLNQKEINENLLDILTVIVEIDDIAFQLEEKVKLPIAFESNFKNVLEYIHKEYIK
jgi:aminoglycoside phosphotransferase (APT) family kinase protein